MVYPGNLNAVQETYCRECYSGLQTQTQRKDCEQPDSFRPILRMNALRNANQSLNLDGQSNYDDDDDDDGLMFIITVMAAMPSFAKTSSVKLFEPVKLVF